MTLAAADIAAAARYNMVANQVRTNKVWDMTLVAALEATPREAYVPDAMRTLAYIDEDIALPGGRVVMEPMVTARMIQALEFASNDVVMEIACGMGFASAVMSRLARTVIAVDSDAGVVEATQARLLAHECDNAVVVHGDVTQGVGERASVDAILITGGVQVEPTALFSLLAPRGRLVCAMVSERGQGQIVLFQKFGESVSQRALFDANVPVLPEFRAVKGFAF